MALALAFAAAFARADDYDVLRQKWKDITTGVGYNTAEPDVISRLSGIASSASGSWSSMDKSPARTYLWSDAASTNISAHLTTCYGRLRAMALAYATAGCSLYTNATLLADTVGGLEWMNGNRYNTVIAQYDNWWDWEIGVPLHLTDTAVLIYDQLTATQRTNYLAAVDYHTPIPDMTQANQVWKARVVAVRGCVVKDSAKLALARDAFTNVFPYVTGSDGFYRDGSFVQHGYQPYTAGYGASLLANLAPVLTWLSGSLWEVTDPAQTNLCRWVFDSFEPIIYRGAAWDLVRGREISRSGSSPQGTGHTFLQNILRVSQFAPPADAARMRSMVKYWAQSDTVRNFVANTPLPQLADAKALMADTNTLPRGELIGHYHFGEMDRVIHLRPGYGFGLSLSSSRIMNFESGNGENMRGWYTGDGMTTLYNAQLDHYGDAYWPTVDHYRMPGTTVDTTMQRTPPTKPTAANGANWQQSYAWVGGSKLDEVGAAGMQLDAWGATLTAKKSWFMFDDEIVCLGAGITSADNRTIETVIENRKLLVSGDNALSMNGSAMPTHLGWSATITNSNWAHLAGNVAGSDVGYYFPTSNRVCALREARTGSWNDVNTGGSTNPVTRNYLTLWFDHGLSPTNETYAYVLLPCFSGSNVASYAASPDVTVLENSTRAQGVSEANSGLTAVNFWQAGTNTLGGVTVDKPCSVIARQSGLWLDVAVADPTQTNTGLIAVEIATAATSAAELDAGVSVTQLSPTVKLAVNATGADGRSYRAKLYLGKVDAVALGPIEDAYVDNTYPSINYGSSTNLVVKYSGGSTLTREAFLRFDLSAQTNGLLLDAVLQMTCSFCNGADTHLVTSVGDPEWSELELVWTNRPAAGTEWARWAVQTNDLPATVGAAVGAAARSAAGGLLGLRVAAVGDVYAAYASRENGVIAHRPTLLLRYAFPSPQVAITAPASGSAAHWSQGVDLTAAASSQGAGGITVRYFDGDVEVGSSAEPPYHVTVTNLSPGVHSFVAVATEEEVLPGTSEPVVIMVSGTPLAASGRALTLKNVPVNVDLSPWAAAYATSAEDLYFSVTQAVSGEVCLLTNRHWACFTPAAEFTGNASFAYKVTDYQTDPRLFLYYDMEQASVINGGAITDASGNGRDGTLDVVGTGWAVLTNAAPGPVASYQALLLRETANYNGARIRRQVGSSELNFSDQSWTFSGWFWRAAQTNEDFIFYIGNGDGYGSNEELHLYGGTGASSLLLRHYIPAGGTDIDINAGQPSLRAWHHVAVTFARTNSASGVMSVYLDGALKATDGSFTLALSQTVPVVFGGHNLSSSWVTRWFNGMLDEVAVFNAALSSNEVATLATRSVAHFGGVSATNSVAVRVLAPEEAPHMNAVGLAAGGAWSMAVSGPSELTYTVEASTNLTEWAPLDTAVHPALPFLWADPASPLFPCRFYRVRVEP